MTTSRAATANLKLVAALAYAERGWRVLPVYEPNGSGCACGQSDCHSPGKHPRIGAWTNEATTDQGTITEWWGRWPEANVGIATGVTSDIFVIDVDVGEGKAGALSLDNLEAKYGPLPHTISVVTGSGGRHLFFRSPGHSVANRIRVRPGLDVKGDNGYVVAPPSIHLSGERYAFEVGSKPDDVQPASAPCWLLDVIAERRPSNGSGPSVAHPDGGKPIPEGERNHTLTRIAGAMRGQGCTPEEIQTAIAEANRNRCSPPLGEREVESIARSIGHYPPSRSSFRGGTYWERAVLEALWDHPDEVRLLTYLVNKAVWCDHEGVFSGLEIGQVLTSIRKLANACSYKKNNQTETWSTSKVDRLLRRLVERGLIEAVVLGHGTLITIVDYGQYKGFPAQNI